MLKRKTLFVALAGTCLVGAASGALTSQSYVTRYCTFSCAPAIRAESIITKTRIFFIILCLIVILSEAKNLPQK